MGAANFAYDFKPGAIYNLEASGIIKNGGGASGAHSDIAHPEVAHAFWSAALAAPLPPAGTLSPGSGTECGAEAAAGCSAAASAGRRPPRARQSQQQAPQFQIQTQEDVVPMRPIRYRDRPSVASRSAPGPPEPAASPGQRCVNVALEDQAADTILQAGSWYTLAFDVDVGQHADALDRGALRRRSRSSRKASTRPRSRCSSTAPTSTFPIRSGRCACRARASRATRRASRSRRATTGPRRSPRRCTRTATSCRASRSPSWSAARCRCRWRRPRAAGRPRPRARFGRATSACQLSLRDGGYDCIAVGAVAARAHLPLQPAFLASAIEAAAARADEGRHAPGRERRLRVPDRHRHRRRRSRLRAQDHGARRRAAVPEGVLRSRRRRRLEADRHLPAHGGERPGQAPRAPGGRRDRADPVGPALHGRRVGGRDARLGSVPGHAPRDRGDSAADHAWRSSTRRSRSDPRLAVSVNVNSGIDAQLGGTYVADTQRLLGRRRRRRGSASA